MSSITTGLRVVVETYDELINTLPLQSPNRIKEVGLNQQDQIKILQNILDVFLPQQFTLLNVVAS